MTSPTQEPKKEEDFEWMGGFYWFKVRKNRIAKFRFKLANGGELVIWEK